MEKTKKQIAHGAKLITYNLGFNFQMINNSQSDTILERMRGIHFI